MDFTYASWPAGRFVGVRSKLCVRTGIGTARFCGQEGLSPVGPGREKDFSLVGGLRPGRLASLGQVHSLLQGSVLHDRWRCPKLENDTNGERIFSQDCAYPSKHPP